MVAAREILRQPGRSMLAGLAISGGVVALMLAGGFVEWNFWNYREATIHSQLGHLQVHKRGFAQEGRADPFAFLLRDDRTELGQIEQVPGVLAVAPRLSFSGIVSVGDASVAFIGEGVEPEPERMLSRGLTMRSGESLLTADSEGILIGEGLAANLGVEPGQRVALLASTASGGINAVEATVRGVFSTLSKAYDDAAIRVPRGLAQRLLRVEGAHAWVLLLDDTERTDPVFSGLKTRIGTSGELEITRWIDNADFYRKSRDLYEKQVVVIKLIIAVIIVLSIGNSLMMSVVQRTGEIGTAMALGNSRRTVLRRFFLEGGVLGVAGAALGAGLGWLLAVWISWIGIPVPPPPGMAHGYAGEIRLTWPIVLDAVVLAVLTSCVASVYPAWKASRLVIVDALRMNR